MSQSRKPWLFGPVHDALWGAGIAYLTVFVLLATVGQEMRSLFPMWVMGFLVVLVSIPHYGATLLRIYEKREDRKQYSRFAMYTTVILGLAFVWGLQDTRVGSLLFTVYLTWSPWHYTGQNYGITLMFLGRQGVSVSARSKRFLHSSFVLSYVLTFFFIHGPYTASNYGGNGIQYLSIGFPAVASDLIVFATSLAYLLSTGVALFVLFRSGPRRTWIALTLILTQAVWFVVPAWVKNWLPYSSVEPLSAEYAQYAFTWIALGHAAQYLWITRYFNRATPRVGNRSFFLPALAAGCIVWVVPALVFAPGVLGRIPFDRGLASLVAALVNLHHFILDGAIWKLRDGRIATVLFGKDRRQVTDSEPVTPRRSLGRPVIVMLGALSFAVLMFGNWEEEFGFRRSLYRGDLARAEKAVERLFWIGRDSADNRRAIGVQAYRAGDLELARRELESAVRLLPSFRGWLTLGRTYDKLGGWRLAANAFEQALVLRPDSPTAKLSRAVAYAELGELGPAQEVLASPPPPKPSAGQRRLRKYLEERVSPEIH